MSEAEAQLETSAGFALDAFIPYLMNRITNRWNRNLAGAMRAAGITTPQWRVLAVLVAGDGRSLTELAVYTVIDQSTLSRTVDRMEEGGLVRRRVRADDGRYTEIHLELKDENTQCIGVPVDGEDQRYLCVIMPMRV